MAATPLEQRTREIVEGAVGPGTRNCSGTVCSDFEE